MRIWEDYSVVYSNIKIYTNVCFFCTLAPKEDTQNYEPETQTGDDKAQTSTVESENVESENVEFETGDSWADAE